MVAQILELQLSERQGLCGNSFCEWGEQRFPQSDINATFCPKDCPISWNSCPKPTVGAAGNPEIMCGDRGRCLPATRACECHAGYGGLDCGECDADHVLAEGRCVPVLHVAHVWNKLEEARAIAAEALELEEQAKKIADQSRSTLMLVRRQSRALVCYAPRGYLVKIFYGSSCVWLDDTFFL